MGVFTTVTGNLGADSSGLNGVIIAENRVQLELTDGTIVPAFTRLTADVQGGAFSIEVPATDTATPASQYIYWFVLEEGAKREKYLGRREVPTSATDVSWASLS